MRRQTAKSLVVAVISGLLFLGSLTDGSRACGNAEHLGDEVFAGFHFGDSPSEVFCESKRSSPNAALRLDLTNRCRGNRFVGISKSLVRQESFQSALSELYSEAIKLKNGSVVDREIFARCYDIESIAMASILKGSDDPRMLIAPAVDMTFVIENLVAFNMGSFRANFGFTDHQLSLYERVNVGLAFEFARQRATKESLLSIRVDADRLYPLWYLSSIQIESYPPKTIEALESVRKGALAFFEHVHDRYPGQIGQDDEWDLIIHRKPADLLLKFDEQSGIVTIRSKVSGDQLEAMNDGVRELYKSVAANRVRSH